jgi:hypothetical protein
MGKAAILAVDDDPVDASALGEGAMLVSFVHRYLATI